MYVGRSGGFAGYPVVNAGTGRQIRWSFSFAGSQDRGVWLDRILRASLGPVASLGLVVGSPVDGKAQTPHWSLEGAPVVGDAVYQVGSLADDAGPETSGIVMSRSRANWFWIHSDGDRNKVYGVDASGAVLATVKVAGFNEVDVEDIAADAEGNLYLANTGDNAEVRDEVEVVRFPEPTPDATKATVTTSWRLRWPDAPRDAESLVIQGGYGWLVARIRLGGEASSLVRFRLDRPDTVQTLEYLGDLPVFDPVAGADLTPDGSQFAITTKKGAYVWRVDGDLTRALTDWPTFSSNFTDTQKEGACFVPQGLLVVAETHEMYLYAGAQFRPDAWPLRLTQPVPVAGGWELTWQATVGVACTVETQSALGAGGWQAVGAAIPGLGRETRLRVPALTAPAFFRLRSDW